MHDYEKKIANIVETLILDLKKYLNYLRILLFYYKHI